MTRRVRIVLLLAPLVGCFDPSRNQPSATTDASTTDASTTDASTTDASTSSDDTTDGGCSPGVFGEVAWDGACFQ